MAIPICWGLYSKAWHVRQVVNGVDLSLVPIPESVLREAIRSSSDRVSKYLAEFPGPIRLPMSFAYTMKMSILTLISGAFCLWLTNQSAHPPGYAFPMSILLFIASPTIFFGGTLFSEAINIVLDSKGPRKNVLFLPTFEANMRWKDMTDRQMKRFSASVDLETLSKDELYLLMTKWRELALASGDSSKVR